MSWFRNQIYHALIKEGLQHYVEQVDAKRIVNWVVDGLEHAAFKNKILDKLNLDTSKHLRKTSVALYHWCQGQLRSFMEWETEATRFNSIRNAASPKKQVPIQQRCFPAHNQKPKEEEFGQRVSKLGQQRTRFECLKCNSTEHSVQSCPRCAPGEAGALLRNRKNNREGYSIEAPNVKKAAMVK